MKKINNILILGLVLLASCSTTNQVQSHKMTDDVYFSSADREDDNGQVQQNEQQPTQQQTVTEQPSNEIRSNNYTAQQQITDQLDTQTTYDSNGSTYITNNYYGSGTYLYDYDDYYYTRNLRRWYEPYYGFGFYSSCYVDPWYYPYNSFSFSISFGNPYWGYRSRYYNPWNGGYPYFNYYSPYYYGYAQNYYSPYWGNSYWNGYNHGYYNGYYNGYYGGYYGDYYPYGSSYYGNNAYYQTNSYYGHRNSSNSNIPAGNGGFLEGGRKSDVNSENNVNNADNGIEAKPVDNNFSNQKPGQNGNFQQGGVINPQKDVNNNSSEKFTTKDGVILQNSNDINNQKTNNQYDNIQVVPGNTDMNTQQKNMQKNIQLENSAPGVTPQNQYNTAPRKDNPQYSTPQIDNTAPKNTTPKYNQNPPHYNTVPKTETPKYNQPQMNNAAPKEKAPKYNQNQQQYNTVPKTETPKYNQPRNNTEPKYEAPKYNQPNQQMNSSPKQYNSPAPKQNNSAPQPRQYSQPQPKGFNENRFENTAPSVRYNSNGNSSGSHQSGEQQVKSFSRMPR